MVINKRERPVMPERRLAELYLVEASLFVVATTVVVICTGLTFTLKMHWVTTAIGCFLAIPIGVYTVRVLVTEGYRYLDLADSVRRTTEQV